MKTITKIIITVLAFLSVCIILPQKILSYTADDFYYNDPTIKKLETPGKASNHMLAAAAQLATANKSDVYFQFDPYKLVNAYKDFNLYTSSAKTAKYGINKLCCACASPDNHDTGKNFQVLTVMDINADGTVTTYSVNKSVRQSKTNPGVVVKTTKSQIGQELAYFAYNSIKNKETTPKNYKYMFRYYLGRRWSEMLDLGVSKILAPHKSSYAKQSMQEGLIAEAQEDFNNGNAYVGRIVFFYSTQFSKGSNGYGQNGMVFCARKVKKPGNIKIKKVDANDNSKTLKGVKFTVQNTSKLEYIKIDNETVSYVKNEADATSFSTDENGEIKINGVEPGTYKVIEIENNNEGYSGTELQSLTKEVKTGKTVTFTIENQPTGGPTMIKIKKKRN